MSEHNVYHALGQQQQGQDSYHQQSDSQPMHSPYNTSGAPTHTPYSQNSTPYAQNGPNANHYGTPGTGYNQSQEQGYFPHQKSGYDGSGEGLATPMGNMGLGVEAVAPVRQAKKKNRHAYHNLEQPAGSSQAFNRVPQGGVNPSQYLNQDQTRRGPGQPYAGQPITSAMNQFPATSSGPFTPGGGQTNFGGVNSELPTPTGPGVSAQGKVDPEQIPSIPRSRDEPAKYYLDHVYPTMEQHLPPPGAIPFVAYDQGNSSPKYARLTLNNIPSSSEALKSTALPLGLVLQPLAPLQAGETPIPVLDFGEIGPPRCRRCRAYINPFMTFRSGGNKFVCNMCTFANEVGSEYFAPTDPSGVRVDRSQRPELTVGTVEFMVPKEYWAKEPVGLRWLFLIDVGQEAINRGFLEAFCEGVLGALYGGGEEGHGEDTQNGGSPGSERKIPLGSKVGFVTFDKDIHFYNCNVRRWQFRAWEPQC